MRARIVAAGTRRLPRNWTLSTVSRAGSCARTKEVPSSATVRKTAQRRRSSKRGKKFLMDKILLVAFLQSIRSARAKRYAERFRKTLPGCLAGSYEQIFPHRVRTSTRNLDIHL